jgi:hypothetical protein
MVISLLGVVSESLDTGGVEKNIEITFEKDQAFFAELEKRQLPRTKSMVPDTIRGTSAIFCSFDLVEDVMSQDQL